MKYCSIEDCNRLVKYRSFCSMHYQRLRKKGALGRPLNEKYGLSKHPLYRTWASMKNRCNNPRCTSYGYYGGKGITVCQEWTLSFKRFLEDMGERPDNHTLDRIDPKKGYSPDNCRWASNSLQSFNKNPRKGTRTGITGVHTVDGKRWIAKIFFDGKYRSLGTYGTVIEATQVRKDAELKYYG